MKIFIKYMVSNRCIMAVRELLKELGLHFIHLQLGSVEVMEELSSSEREQLRIGLSKTGLELMDNKKAILIERIKNEIIQMIHHLEEPLKVNFSQFLSEQLQHPYNYLSNLFSESQGTTIEQFMILHKVERIKELIIYDELNLTEIAYHMNYSSVGHLSNQFKKVTGLTPTHFKNMKEKRRGPIEEI